MTVNLSKWSNDLNKSFISSITKENTQVVQKFIKIFLFVFKHGLGLRQALIFLKLHVK